MKKLLLLTLAISVLLCGCKKDEEQEEEDYVTYETGSGENPFIDLSDFNVTTMSFVDERSSSADYAFDFDSDFGSLIGENGIYIMSRITKYYGNNVIGEFYEDDFHDYVNAIEYCCYYDDFIGEDHAIHYKLNDSCYYLCDNTVTFTDDFEPESTNGVGNTVDLLLSIINSGLESTESVVVDNGTVYYKCKFKDGIIYESYGIPNIVVFNVGEFTYVQNIYTMFFGLDESMFHILDNYDNKLPEYDELVE